MDRDSKFIERNGTLPVFAQVTKEKGIHEICEHILGTWKNALGAPKAEVSS